MLEFALLILTINANGDIRATVSPAEDMPACQASLEAVSGILEGAGSEIVKITCGQTAQRLTPFDHALGVEDEVYRYRVTVAYGDFSLVPFEAGNCTPGREGDAEVFCTVSSQHLLE